jgi:hypothetical protein
LAVGQEKPAWAVAQGRLSRILLPASFDDLAFFHFLSARRHRLHRTTRPTRGFLHTKKTIGEGRRTIVIKWF